MAYIGHMMKEKIDQFKSLLRKRLLKLIIGEDIMNVVNLYTIAKNNTASLISLNKQIKDIQETLLEVINLTGGEGWTQTIQSAILRLSENLSQQAEILMEHEENFENMFDESEGYFEVDIEEDKMN